MEELTLDPPQVSKRITFQQNQNPPGYSDYKLLYTNSLLIILEFIFD